MILDGMSREEARKIRYPSTRRMKHGDARRGQAEPLYLTWRSMVRRCCDPCNPCYEYYGGRGIGVCAAWLDYSAFKAWALNNGYAHGLELDRRNNDGSYEPTNCRFVTHRENAGNKRDSIIITSNGESHCMAEWSRRIYGNRHALRDRVRRGANAQHIIDKHSDKLALLVGGAR